MKAVVWHGVGNIQVQDVAEPTIEKPADAIVRITTSAICGTDLHLVRGTMPGVKDGRILGHEGVGEVVAVGSEVRNFAVGDRVVIPSTICCGYCSYCRAGYQSQCDNANPAGKKAGTAFFGGPETAGGFDGLQAQYARVPHANATMVALPAQVSDLQGIMLSDIFPTAWFGAKLAEVSIGDTVAVFGCGPVGQLAILSAQLQGAGRVFAVDRHEDRLEMARARHAETINFDAEDPRSVIAELTGGIGVDRAIDAVGVDAQRPAAGPAARLDEREAEQYDTERHQVASRTNVQGDNWVPGDAPSQAIRWAVDVLAKAGTLGIIGVYPSTLHSFPIGAAMTKNLTINMGNCNHRHYVPYLVDLVANGTVDLSPLTQKEPMSDVLEAYRHFDRREPGWIKVSLQPAAF